MTPAAWRLLTELSELDEAMGDDPSAFQSELMGSMAEEAEIVRDGGTVWLGAQRYATRTLDQLLACVAVTHTGGEIGRAGHVERYSLNGVGRSILRRPELEKEVRFTIHKGFSFTVEDDRITLMIAGQEVGQPCARNGCAGVLERATTLEACQCNATPRPPCGWCEAAIHCPECGRTI